MLTSEDLHQQLGHVIVNFTQRDSLGPLSKLADVK